MHPKKIPKTIIKPIKRPDILHSKIFKKKNFNCTKPQNSLCSYERINPNEFSVPCRGKMKILQRRK